MTGWNVNASAASAPARAAAKPRLPALADQTALGRLSSRRGNEHGWDERTGTLTRKLEVVVEPDRAPTDILDTDRATRLETTVVVLIVTEILVTF